MNNLVVLHHNEPMTTSLAVADGVQLAHASILKLIRNHIDALSNFGGVGFEIQPFDTAGGKQWRDVYFLNEQQSTLLITFMRNSEIVVKFKVALVKAFFQLRTQALAARPPARVTHPDVIVPEHEANMVVTADRTYRALIRSGTAAGYSHRQACERAGEVVRQMTGVDIHRLVAPPPKDTGLLVKEHMARWKAGKEKDSPYEYPVEPRDSTNIWAGYRDLCRARGLVPIDHDQWLNMPSDEGYPVNTEISYAPGGWGWQIRQRRLRKEGQLDSEADL